MYKKIIFIPILSLLFLEGCMSAILSYKVQSKYDKFENSTTNYTLFNWMGTNSSSYGRFSFDLMETEKEGNSNYYVTIVYYGSDWFFIDSGESLVLLIDGDRVGLTGDGSFNNREVVTGDLVNEIAYYDIDKQLIEKIINAKNVEVKIIGKYSTTRYFTPENFTRLVSFYNQYIK